MTRFPKMVYFARAAEKLGPVKIGSSRWPAKRAADLSRIGKAPIEVITTVAGTAALEFKIHKCFAHLHLGHEWFRPSAKLILTIDRLVAGASIDEALDLTDITGETRAAPSPSRWGA